MTYSFHDEAELEFNDAIDHYEGCRNDLGFEFAIEEKYAYPADIQNFFEKTT